MFLHAAQMDLVKSRKRKRQQRDDGDNPCVSPLTPREIRAQALLNILKLCKVPLHADLLPMVVETVNQQDYQWKARPDGLLLSNQNTQVTSCDSEVELTAAIGDTPFGENPLDFKISLTLHGTSVTACLGIA